MADMTKAFNISQTGIVTWVINRDPYTEASTPVLYGNASDGWNASTTLHLPFNSTIDIIMSVADDAMDNVSLSQLLKVTLHALPVATSWSSILTMFPDGPPHPSPWPQILGSGLRKWEIPTLFCGCCTFIYDQPSQSPLQRYD